MKYPKDHPVWTIARHSVYLGFATLILYTNASNFDHTEIKTILEMGLVFIGADYAKSKLSKSKEKD